MEVLHDFRASCVFVYVCACVRAFFFFTCEEKSVNIIYLEVGGKFAARTGGLGGPFLCGMRTLHFTSKSEKYLGFRKACKYNCRVYVLK